MIVFGPFTAEDGEKTPVTVLTPIPDHEPPGTEAERLTEVPLEHKGPGKFVMVTTGASITVIGTVEADKQTSFNV
jgi:hypothetical protein